MSEKMLCPRCGSPLLILVRKRTYFCPTCKSVLRVLSDGISYL